MYILFLIILFISILLFNSGWLTDVVFKHIFLFLNKFIFNILNYIILNINFIYFFFSNFNLNLIFIFNNYSNLLLLISNIVNNLFSKLIYNTNYVFTICISYINSVPFFLSFNNIFLDLMFDIFIFFFSNVIKLEYKMNCFFINVYNNFNLDYFYLNSFYMTILIISLKLSSYIDDISCCLLILYSYLVIGDYSNYCIFLFVILLNCVFIYFSFLNDFIYNLINNFVMYVYYYYCISFFNFNFNNILCFWYSTYNLCFIHSSQLHFLIFYNWYWVMVDLVWVLLLIFLYCY